MADSNNVKQEKKLEIHTLLKFVQSEHNSSMVSYVSTNPVNGQVKGVRADSEFPHKIVVCAQAIQPVILAGVLYRATIVPMNSGKGYVCKEAEPVQFKATVKTNYVPKESYQIVVSFGNKALVFDPFKGKKASVLTTMGFVDLLEHRVDLQDQDKVVMEFKVMADELLKQMRKDGVRSVRIA